jgi:hypothetical protein
VAAPTVAEAAILIKALGIEEVRRDLLKVEGALKAATRTPAGADRALDPIRRRVDLLTQGAKHDATRAASLTRLAGIENGLQKTIDRGNLSLAQRIKLQEQLNRVHAVTRAPAGGVAPVPVPARGGLGGLMPKLGSMGAMAGSMLGGLGVGVAIGAVAGAFGRMSTAMDNAETAERKLIGTSRMTGVELATVAALAQEASNKYVLNSVTAADLTSGVVKLAQGAGQVGESSRLMAAWLDLSAAAGIGAAEAADGLSSALAGNDEFLNRLGLANPGEIYKKWGAGTDQASQRQALFNEIITQGAKLTGQYESRLNSAAGQGERMAAASENMWAALGKVVIPIREIAYDLGTRFSGWVTENAGRLTILGKIVGGVLAYQFNLMAFALGTVIDLMQFGMNGALGGFAKAAETILSLLAKLSRGFASMAAAVGLDGVAAKFAEGAENIETLRNTVGSFANEKLSNAGAQLSQIWRRGEGTVGAIRNAVSGNAAAGAAAASVMGSTTPGGAGAGGAGGGGAGGGAASTALGNVFANTAAPALASINPAMGGVGMTVPLPVTPVLGPIPTEQWLGRIEELRGQTDGLFATFGNGVGNVLADSLGTAFTDGIGAAGDVLLSGLGGMLMEMGKAMLVQGAVMVGLLPALSNPFTSGPALLAAGAVLVALGGTLAAISGGKGGKGGGGGGGSSGPTAFADDTRSVAIGGGSVAKGSASPDVAMRTGDAAKAAMPVAPITVNANIIGPSDPQAQRQIVDLMQNAARRGLTVGG